MCSATHSAVLIVNTVSRFLFQFGDVATNMEISPTRRIQTLEVYENLHRGDNGSKILANIHQSIPKVPDVLWFKKLLNFDRRKRPLPIAQDVPQLSQADTRIQGASPVPRPPTSSRLAATTGIDPIDTSQPETRGSTPTKISNADTTVQNGSLRSDRWTPVRTLSGTVELQGTEPLPPAVSLPQLQATPESEKDPAPPIGARSALGEPLNTTENQVSDPVMSPAVPAMRFQTPEQRLRDDSGLLHRNPQKEQYALRHVYMVVEHCMKDSERTLAALLIDMEDHNGSRRISVTCYDGAVDKAREIEAILFRAGRGLQGYSFIVRRKRSARTFGFKGPGSGHGYEHISMADNARAHSGDAYRYVYPSKFDHSNHDERPHRPKGSQNYANTVYWTPQSTMVECFCADQPSGNMAATPIRMHVGLDDGTFATCAWTCGGVVNVGGTNYGLTTAHPYVLGDAMQPTSPPRVKQWFEGTKMTEDSFADGDLPEVDANFFPMHEDLKSHWQPIGKVSHYALAKIGFFPSNNDWLLIDLPKDRVVWNAFKGAAGSDPNVLTVHTSRAVLVATLLGGSAYLILGDSPFEVLKIGLLEPLRKYTSVQEYGTSN